MKAKIVYIALALALAFSMSAVVVPASPAQAATDYYVNGTTGNDSWDGLSPTYTGDTNGPKATIQAAVNTAVATDTINVAAGTYNENVIVSVANLTLRGANEGKSAGADPETRGSESIIIGRITIQLNNVVIDGFRINSAGYSGIYINGGTSGHTISNNVVYGPGDTGYRGIEFSNDTSSIVVSDNEFTNWTSGIYVAPSGDNDLEVTGNDFHDNLVGIGSDGLNNVSIQHNDFSDNELEGFGSSNVGTNVQAHNNNFYLSDDREIGVSFFGINNYGGQVIDATDNWWGHAKGPYDGSDDTATGGWYNPLGGGSEVSDLVKYEPYRVEEGDGGGGCFIATAAYGTASAEEIDVLRAFRDEVLLESTVGSQLVELYYQTSPPVADFISENDVLRTLVRELVVDPIASVVEATGTLWRD